jgi:PAS domain S-box-containing protein
MMDEKKKLEIANKILDTIPELIALQDKNMKLLWVNRAACDSVGKKPEELIGRHCYEIWHHRNKPCDDCPVKKAMKSGNEESGEITSPDGRVWFIRGVPLKDEKGRINEILEITKEITEEKKAQNKIAESEKKFRMFFENAPDAFYINDLKGNFLDGNKEAERITDYKKEELIGKSFLSLKLLPKEQIPKAAELLAKNILGMPTGPDELTLVRKDGSKVVVEIRTYPIEIEGKKMVLGVARDVTERKKIIEELKRRTEDAERLARLAVGRELKMAELKKRIRELEEQLKEKNK